MAFEIDATLGLEDVTSSLAFVFFRITTEGAPTIINIVLFLKPSKVVRNKSDILKINMIQFNTSLTHDIAIIPTSL